MKLYLRLLFFFLIALLYSHSAYTEGVIDLSEKLLQPRHKIVFPFGDRGFGFYDYGDAKFKVFDWKFNITNEIPIKQGEGPGEIRRLIITACLFKDNLLLTPLGEKKIIVYNLNGKYIQTWQPGIVPRNIINVNDRLYISNYRYCKEDNSPRLAITIDTNSGSTLEEIRLKERLIPVKTGDEAVVTGLSSFFDIGENKNIYVLLGELNTIFEIDATGNCSWKIELPFKNREKRWTEKNNGKVDLVVSSLDFYLDMKLVKNTIFACFRKTLKQEEGSNLKVCQTYVIKVLKDKKPSTKIFDGVYCILGEANGNLYLFNHDDYKVLPVKLSEWD